MVARVVCIDETSFRLRVTPRVFYRHCAVSVAIGLIINSDDVRAHRPAASIAQLVEHRLEASVAVVQVHVEAAAMENCLPGRRETCNSNDSHADRVSLTGKGAGCNPAGSMHPLHVRVMPLSRLRDSVTPHAASIALLL